MTFSTVITSTFFGISQNNTLPTNGNIGIGTTSPTTQLDVRGNVSVDSTLTVGDSAVFESTFTVQGVSRLQEDAILTKDLRVDGTSEIFGPLNTYNTIKLTNTPDATGNYTGFKVLGIDAQGVVKSIELPANTGSQLFLPPKNCNSDASGNNSATPYWDYGYNKIFVECPGTNVGLGTNAPTHKLSVIGSQFTSGTSQIGQGLGVNSAPSSFSRVVINTGSTFSAALELNGNNNNFNKLIFCNVTTPSTEIMKVYNTTTNTTPFLFTADGKMVIHNGTQKIFQLNANGVLQTRTVKVDVYNWPDYVFDPSYKRLTLNQLEAYINENKHLPNVPTATEAEADGIDLSEMNKVLLQKVEELTLYILEQNKRIEVLEKTVNH